MAADQQPSKAEHLVDMARAEFADLSAAEEKLLRSAAVGERAACGPSPELEDPSNNPANSDEWGSEREIRADRIRWLCLVPEASSRVDPAGVQVVGAKITGELDISHGQIPFPLFLLRCHLKEAAGLNWARLPVLSLQGSRTRSISADGLGVEGGVFFRGGFAAEGEVRLLGARIGGPLDCLGSSFKNPPQVAHDGKVIDGTGKALSADRANIKGTVFLNRGFTAEGEVRLPGAQIGGNFECDYGTFRNPARVGADGRLVDGTAKALSADGVDVRGHVFLRKGFTAEGEVRLMGAQIGGSFECNGGTFKNPPQMGAHQKTLSGTGDALSADRAILRGGVYLGTGFTADGEVRLHGARVAGDLFCSGGRFSIVSAQAAVIEGGLIWRKIVNCKEAKLDLTHASALAIVDEEKSWPAKGNLALDGFVYAGFPASPADAQKRLEWLDRLQTFTLQPYRQLARVLRETGDDRGAKLVLYEMEHRRREKEDRTPWAWLWGRVLRCTIGYAHYPRRVGWWLLALVLACSVLFGLGYLRGTISPTNQAAYGSFEQQGHRPDYYPGFNPFIYSLENSVQVLRLGQGDTWQPDPSPQGAGRAPVRGSSWWEKPLASWAFAWVPAWFTRPTTLLCVRWGQIILGWVLVALFLAGVTGIARRE